ncbi:hypothetical protein K7X08_036210 [Anisodus acutangulus]|uniref:Glycoside hydrolase family 3 N-terminal domain-containing protein n=1 Tax=Anisodus acutangulus TaxID=402998 RepID=A0A9Q1QUN4_9SOLA|nr:hypothetical protein K7X08_036210 [Anisodus acutangulus]
MRRIGDATVLEVRATGISYVFAPCIAVGTLKFKGFVISDWQGIDRLASTPHDNYTYSVETSILAGVDMVMVPYNFTEFINDLTYLVKNNFIPMDRIDDAVERILSVKFTMVLFEDPYTDFSDQRGWEPGTQELSKSSCAEISCATEEWENC